MNPEDPPLTPTQKVRRWRRRNELFEQETNAKLEKERYETATINEDDPAKAVKKYLLAALPDVAKALVVKATSNAVSSVSATRVIFQILGVEKNRNILAGALDTTFTGYEPLPDEQEIQELAEDLPDQEEMQELAEEIADGDRPD